MSKETEGPHGLPELLHFQIQNNPNYGPILAFGGMTLTWNYIKYECLPILKFEKKVYTCGFLIRFKPLIRTVSWPLMVTVLHDYVSISMWHIVALCFLRRFLNKFLKHSRVKTQKPLFRLLWESEIYPKCSYLNTKT